MPWKGEKDPYKIWLSEIILQQTRVDQGLKYYKRFIDIFPDVQKLAKANDPQVYKLWEGLGYYSRCSNLLFTARYITKEKAGKFPENYEELKKLKGVGPYTAAAISSFAFNKPHAVVDGNVFRVLSRVFGIKKPIDSAEGKKYFANLANELIDKRTPGTYNQAIMDFGAVICKPVPDCNNCIFQKNCIAFFNDKTRDFPVKQKRLAIKPRWFYYLVMDYKNKIAVSQRIQADIWKHLYEFPMIETSRPFNYNTVIQKTKKKEAWPEGKIEIKGKPVFIKQQISHQLIHATFIPISIKKRPLRKNGWIWVDPASLSDYGFPRVIRHYIHSAF
jgi:A/G-specific adenine glycosylase